jgi:hypothetical protein
VGSVDEGRSGSDFKVKERKEDVLYNVGGEARKEKRLCCTMSAVKQGRGVERKARASSRTGSSKLTYDDRKPSRSHHETKLMSLLMRCIVVHARPI